MFRKLSNRFVVVGFNRFVMHFTARVLANLVLDQGAFRNPHRLSKIASEVQHIQSYVEIEKVRFGDRLNVEYDIQESDFLVPPLAIQPLVENAIKHGVCKRPEGGTVWLRSYREGNNFIVEVEDNGVGIPKDRLDAVLGNSEEGYFGDFGIGGRRMDLTGNGSEEHQSTGMKNIIMRLKEMSHAELKIESEVGKGTLMRVVIPPQL